MTQALIDQFFEAYARYDKETFGQYATWSYSPSSGIEKDFSKLEQQFQTKFPDSFKQFYSRYNFSEIETPLLTLTGSDPDLSSLAAEYNWDLPKLLTGNRLYVFGDGGNDIGPLVFDGREPKSGNEFPIREYDHEYIDGEPEALTEIMFSSFTKMIECLLHFLEEGSKTGYNAAIRQFYHIDPAGAGDDGRGYWTPWFAMPDESE